MVLEIIGFLKWWFVHLIADFRSISEVYGHDVTSQDNTIKATVFELDILKKTIRTLFQLLKWNLN